MQTYPMQLEICTDEKHAHATDSVTTRCLCVHGFFVNIHAHKTSNIINTMLGEAWGSIINRRVKPFQLSRFTPAWNHTSNLYHSGVITTLVLSKALRRRALSAVLAQHTVP